MKRLTTDCATNNFEAMMNYVFGRDGWAHIISDGEHENVPLTVWAKEQCIKRGCDEFPGETPEEIDETLCDCLADGDGCPVALAYCFGCQACHLRDRLKLYEDTGLMPGEIMGLCSMDKRANMAELLRAEENPPLTLEQLLDMDGEPVFVAQVNKHTLFSDAWMLVTDYGAIDRKQSMVFDEYGRTWLAYRRKPEEQSC